MSLRSYLSQLQLAFYDIALAGVKDCQEMCKAASIPYERPKDYYAEMVKTDEHMLKVFAPYDQLLPCSLHAMAILQLLTVCCHEMC